MPQRNIELLKKVREEVRRDQRRKNKRVAMADWFRFPVLREKADQTLVITVDDVPNSCGTTACVAGWAALLHGDKIVFEIPSQTYIEAYCTPSSTLTYSAIIARNGVRMPSMQDRGQKLLGLTWQEADFLFTRPDDQALWALNKFIAGWSLERMEGTPGHKRTHHRSYRRPNRTPSFLEDE